MATTTTTTMRPLINLNLKVKAEDVTLNLELPLFLDTRVPERTTYVTQLAEDLEASGEEELQLNPEVFGDAWLGKSKKSGVSSLFYVNTVFADVKISVGVYEGHFSHCAALEALYELVQELSSEDLKEFKFKVKKASISPTKAGKSAFTDEDRKSLYL